MQDWIRLLTVGSPWQLVWCLGCTSQFRVVWLAYPCLAAAYDGGQEADHQASPQICPTTGLQSEPHEQVLFVCSACVLSRALKSAQWLLPSTKLDRNRPGGMWTVFYPRIVDLGL